MIPSQFRYTYSNIEMILNGCGSHMMFLYKMFSLVGYRKIVLSVIYDTLRSLFTNKAL